ncbi:glycine betaine ABC transporter substrate-binding protein [Pseudomonas sp. NPDC088444]|uniref:glycine betaine ABC transporter substrate-binding protein n=1 Tax=Pseudomonas sp. NPDC088444 TaxID=3364456 RepID=UPI00384CB029
MVAYSPHKKKRIGWFAGVALATVSLFGYLSVQAADQPPVRIGWVNWSDTEIAVKLANVVLEDQLKQPVKLVQADIGIQFQAMANGNIDLIPMVWLPGTHKAFWDKYQDKLEDLGVLYEGRIGMAVPDIVPESEVKSLADLNKPGIAAKFDGKILTSEVGNGQYKLTEKVINDKKIVGYKMVASSESGMLSELDRNLKRGKWSLVNAWSPHWMFSKYPLRYLDDPEHMFGGAEQIHAVARKGFSAQYPQVAQFFAHYSIPAADLQDLMLKAKESSAEKVVAEYYAANKARFAAMVNGNATASTTP